MIWRQQYFVLFTQSQLVEICVKVGISAIALHSNCSVGFLCTVHAVQRICTFESSTLGLKGLTTYIVLLCALKLNFTILQCINTSIKCYLPADKRILYSMYFVYSI